MNKRNIARVNAAKLMIPLYKKAVIEYVLYPKQPLLSMKHLDLPDDEKEKAYEEYMKMLNALRHRPGEIRAHSYKIIFNWKNDKQIKKNDRMKK